MMKNNIFLKISFFLLACLLVIGCSTSEKPGMDVNPLREPASQADYIIGSGDDLNIFVWRNPELSVTVPVRPDGNISVPLVEDMQAAGKSPTVLARDIEEQFKHYIRDPVVTVMVTNFVGSYDRQIRVVGAAAKPQSLPYRTGMTLLDVMIAVGGLGEFAEGNKAKIVRQFNEKQMEIKVRLEDLIQDGDINSNVRMQPGDILIIPESWF
jgi:polysaccharide export outer membrane protein